VCFNLIQLRFHKLNCETSSVHNLNYFIPLSLLLGKKKIEKKKIQALTRFMLPVGDPLKDSVSGEEEERKKTKLEDFLQCRAAHKK